MGVESGNESDFAFSSVFQIKLAAQVENTGGIMVLNDDCLQEVFGYLNTLNLLVVASVCKRFHINAHHRLSAAFRSIDVSNWKQAKGLIRKPYKLRSLRAFFTCFGDYVNELALWACDIRSINLDEALVEQNVHNGNIEGRQVPARTLDMLGEECSVLEKLTLKYFILTDKMCQLNGVQELFGRLTSLTLESCSIRMKNKWVALLFTESINLTSLTLILHGPYTYYGRDNTSFSCDHLPFQNIPNLKELNIKCPCKNLPELIKASINNDKWEILRISDRGGSGINEQELFESIICCKQLTVLQIEPNWLLSEEKQRILTENLPNLRQELI